MTKDDRARSKTRSLVFRLYLISLFQLVLLAVAVVGVGFIVRPTPPDHGPPPDERHHVDEHRPDHRHHRPGPWAPLVTFFASGIVIVAVGALLTARWITRPLGQLADAARSLGEGNLRTRVGLARSDEIGDVAHAFDEMAERVEKLVLAEKELMANVSHELRTPLARIGVHLELASEGDAATVRASLAEIAVDLSELVTLMDDILMTTRFELAEGRAPTTALPLHRTATSPADVARRAEERFRARHALRPLEVRLGDDLPDVDIDPILFRRVLENLLENAHRYTTDAAVPVELRVHHRHDEAGDDVIFEVEDRGIGIAKDDLPLLFTPFFRTDRSRSRVSGGVGLGLALARRIVIAHGGRIELESEPNRGTTARVHLSPAAKRASDRVTGSAPDRVTK